MATVVSSNHSYDIFYTQRTPPYTVQKKHGHISCTSRQEGARAIRRQMVAVEEETATTVFIWFGFLDGKKTCLEGGITDETER